MRVQTVLHFFYKFLTCSEHLLHYFHKCNVCLTWLVETVQILVFLANLSVIFAIKTAKVMAVVKTESLFFTPMLSLLEKPSRIQSADQNELTEIAYEMIDLTEDFATDCQEFKTSTAERIEPLI